MPPVSAQKLQDWKDQGFEPGNCPVRQVLDHVSAKWPVLILLELGRKPMRFNELLRALPDISKRMLTQSLRNLERDGILRREVFDTWGLYDTSFRIAADYDAMLRYLARGGIRLAYVPEVFVKMRVGGESNKSIRKILRKSSEDYRAIRTNGVGGMETLALKNLSKIQQFF